MRGFLTQRRLSAFAAIGIYLATGALLVGCGSAPNDVIQSPSITTSAATTTDLTLHDYLGAKRSLSEWNDKDALVLVFIGADCPVSKHYGSRLAQLAEQYDDKNVQFLGIDSNRQDSLADVERYAREYKIEFPILKDPGNKVADQFAAERMSEVFLLDRDRGSRYRGRIDDQFGVGYARGQASQNYLASALDEVLAGKPVTTSAVPAVGCVIGRVQRDAPTGDITYTKSISPLLSEHCVRCHRSGEVAPFALTSYDEVAGWGDTIVEVIRDDRMPPWHANPAHGHFSNDARLPSAAKETISAWVKNGMPEGNPQDLPPARSFVDGWQISKPELIVEMPAAYDVPARGVVPYQHFDVGKTFEKDTWIRAAEARPGNRAVVHHLILFYTLPGQARPRGEDALSNAIATFAPGMPSMDLPSGYAMRVPAGSRLVMQAHYTPNGSPQSDRSTAALVFAEPEDVKHELTIKAAMNFRFRIPPGDDNYSVEAVFRVREDSLLYSLMPHMHYRGKSFRFTARYPDGKEEILLDVPRYDFN
jgi:peroxiredoxin/mono/diheme cytochrome c family protein